MKTLLLLSLSLFVTNTVLAKDCVFEIEKEDIHLDWEAYKTPEKVGVKGGIKELGLKEKYKGKDLKSVLEGMEFKIDTTSVRSRNAVRDARIVKFFFGKMVGGFYITGKVKTYTDKKITVTLSMNGLSKEIELTTEHKKGKLIAVGVVDVLNFGMEKSVSELNKACYELHSGKTWSDVMVTLTVEYEKECK